MPEEKIINIQRNETPNKVNDVVMLPVDLIDPLKNHAYAKSAQNVDDIIGSIAANGVNEPINVIRSENGRYEVYSGHRRLLCCQKTGQKQIPAIIDNISRDEAYIRMDNMNKHRNVFPSERAQALTVKYEIRQKQKKFADNPNRLTPLQLLAEEEGMKENALRTYLDLVKLIDPLTELIDNRQMDLSIAAVIASFDPKEQYLVFNCIDENGCSVSGKQVKALRALRGKLTKENIENVLINNKVQEPKISLKFSEIRENYPESATIKEMHDVSVALNKVAKDKIPSFLEQLRTKGFIDLAMPTVKPPEPPKLTEKPPEQPKPTVKPAEQPKPTVKPPEPPTLTEKPPEQPKPTVKPTEPPKPTEKLPEPLKPAVKPLEPPKSTVKSLNLPDKPIVTMKLTEQPKSTGKAKKKTDRDAR